MYQLYTKMKQNIETFDTKCREKDGTLQWSEDGIMTACVMPREKYEDPTVVLFQAKESLPLTKNVKQSYVEYFSRVYPSSYKSLWNKLNVDELRKLYENLEIWYNYSDHPPGKQEIRSAFKPFYRVPEKVNLQQYTDRRGFPNESWVEVFHSGHMNTDFYIPSEMFAGTFYYAARGSGVFLPMGKTLIALNKVAALKKLKVPNDVIKQNAGKAFLRWLAREEKKIAKEQPSLSPTEVQTIALDNQIKAMVAGKNKTASDDKLCYYGLGDTGDRLLALAAVQAGYDTIQLIHEAQLGCDKRGVLVGFEIIDLRNPLVSAQSLRMAVPKEYVTDPKGYY